MRAIQFLVILFLLTALVACAAIGVPATSDPAMKLRQALGLMSHRPFVAEMLIREAREIYQHQNDELGLANAFFFYALFFRDGAFGPQYRFLEKSATYETRFDKSIEYFEKARKLDEKHARHERLAIISMEIVKTYGRMYEEER